MLECLSKQIQKWYHLNILNIQKCRTEHLYTKFELAEEILHILS